MIMDELCIEKVFQRERNENNDIDLLSCHVSLMNIVIYDNNTNTIRSSNLSYADKIPIKYQLFKNSILNNIFMKDEHKQNIIYIFGKYNRLCNAFILLKTVWLRKKKKHIKYEKTISFDPMKDIPSQLILPLYENNHIFHVYLKDISSVIKHALFHQHNLFIEPTEPRNPYTNIPISKYNLYRICLKLKEYNLIHPVINNYFKCDFNLEQFKSIYYIQLQLHSIRQYLKRLTLEQKYNLLVSIFSKYDRKELSLFTNTLKQVFVNDCSKLIHAEIVMLCFDEGYYDLIDYYRNIALDEVSRLKKIYKTYLHKRTNQTIYTYSSTLTDDYLETLV